MFSSIHLLTTNQSNPIQSNRIQYNYTYVYALRLLNHSLIYSHTHSIHTRFLISNALQMLRVYSLILQVLLLLLLMLLRLLYAIGFSLPTLLLLLLLLFITLNHETNNLMHAIIKKEDNDATRDVYGYFGLFSVCLFDCFLYPFFGRVNSISKYDL